MILAPNICRQELQVALTAGPALDPEVSLDLEAGLSASVALIPDGMFCFVVCWNSYLAYLLFSFAPLIGNARMFLLSSTEH